MLVGAGFYATFHRINRMEEFAKRFAAADVKLRLSERKSDELGPAAFGDSSSDFTAYSAEGVDQARIIGLRRAGRDECEPGPWAVCLSGWEAPLPLLNPVLE